jgi:hypothetical protein
LGYDGYAASKGFLREYGKELEQEPLSEGEFEVKDV